MKGTLVVATRGPRVAAASRVSELIPAHAARPRDPSQVPGPCSQEQSVIQAWVPPLGPAAGPWWPAGSVHVRGGSLAGAAEGPAVTGVDRAQRAGGRAQTHHARGPIRPDDRHTEAVGGLGWVGRGQAWLPLVFCGSAGACVGGSVGRGECRLGSKVSFSSEAGAAFPWLCDAHSTLCRKEAMPSTAEAACGFRKDVCEKPAQRLLCGRSPGWPLSQAPGFCLRILLCPSPSDESWNKRYESQVVVSHPILRTVLRRTECRLESALAGPLDGWTAGWWGHTMAGLLNGGTTRWQDHSMAGPLKGGTTQWQGHLMARPG